MTCQQQQCVLPLAWLAISPPVSTSTFGFSQTAHGCLSGGIVLPHEIGHNAGLDHDRYTCTQQNGSKPPSSLYNFGYVNLNARLITIMSYLSACSCVDADSCPII